MQMGNARKSSVGPLSAKEAVACPRSESLMDQTAHRYSKECGSREGVSFACSIDSVKGGADPVSMSLLTNRAFSLSTPSLSDQKYEEQSILVPLVH